MGCQKDQERVIKTLYGVPIVRSHDTTVRGVGNSMVIPHILNTSWTTKSNKGRGQGHADLTSEQLGGEGEFSQERSELIEKRLSS